MNKKSIIIFIVGVNAIAWGGLTLFQSLVSDQTLANSIAVPLIALGPLIMAIGLRLTFRQGWATAGLKFNLKGNLKWYAFAVAFPLMVIAVVYLLAVGTGVGYLQEDISGGLTTLLKLTMIMAVPMTFASIGEEFGWRGYLEPGLHELGGSTIVNHAIVGIVWGVWHFPLIILNSGDINPAELGLIVIGCIGLAMVYGQIRIRTDSVWPCVLLHAAMNTVNVSFAVSKLLVVEDGYKGLVSLNSTSLAVTGSWLLAGFLFIYFLKARTAAEDWFAENG